MSPWVRPENLEFPHVYCTFEGKDRGSDAIIEYRIQDILEEHYEIAVDMMATIFLKDEAISYRIYNDPNSVNLLRNMWTKSLKQRASLGCYRNDGSNELVGMNVLTVRSKDDPDSEPENENIKPIGGMMEYTFEQVDIFNRFGIDRYLYGFGLTIDPSYRGCGLATELLKARVPLMKFIGLNVTVTSFTGIGSQKAAEKAGFEDVYVKSYEELKAISPTYDFYNNKQKLYKIKAMKI